MAQSNDSPVWPYDDGWDAFFVAFRNKRNRDSWKPRPKVVAYWVIVDPDFAVVKLFGEFVLPRRVIRHST